VKYELGSVPGRASPGYSDLGELSGAREGVATTSSRPGGCKSWGRRGDAGVARKYVAAAQHVARNLGSLAAGGEFDPLTGRAGLRRDF